MSKSNAPKQVSAEVIISVGSPLGDGYHSHKLEGRSLAFYLGDKPIGELPFFVNTPIPERLPKWPRALSLNPDLDERAN